VIVSQWNTNQVIKTADWLSGLANPWFESVSSVTTPFVFSCLTNDKLSSSSHIVLTSDI